MPVLISDEPFFPGISDSYATTEPEEVTLGEIVVVARRTRLAPERPTIEHDGGGVGYDPGGTPGEGGSGTFVDPTAAPTVSHDGSIAGQIAAEDFVEHMDRIDEIVDGLPPTAVFTLPDGRQMTGAQIQDLWRSMSFTFTSNGQYANDPLRAGANNNGNVEMDANQYLAYRNSYGVDVGATWFALHELGHISDFNNEADIRFLADYVASGGSENNYQTDGNGWFRNNEIYANQQGAAFGDIFGIDTPLNPTHGFTYDYAFY